MGCFDVVCGISRLKIRREEPIVLLPIAEEDPYLPTNPFSIYPPVLFPVSGTYDEYGSIILDTTDKHNMDVHNINVQSAKGIVWNEDQHSIGFRPYSWDKGYTYSIFDFKEEDSKLKDRVDFAIFHKDAWDYVVNKPNRVETFEKFKKRILDILNEDMEHYKKFPDLFSRELMMMDKIPRSMYNRFVCNVHKIPAVFDNLKSVLDIKNETFLNSFYDLVLLHNFMDKQGIHLLPAMNLGFQHFTTEETQEKIDFLKFSITLMEKKIKEDESRYSE